MSDKQSVTIELTHPLHSAVMALADTEYFGNSVEDTYANLIAAKVRELIASGELDALVKRHREEIAE